MITKEAMAQAVYAESVLKKLATAVAQFTENGGDLTYLEKRAGIPLSKLLKRLIPVLARKKALQKTIARTPNYFSKNLGVEDIAPNYFRESLKIKDVPPNYFRESLGGDIPPNYFKEQLEVSDIPNYFERLLKK